MAGSCWCEHGQPLSAAGCCHMPHVSAGTYVTATPVSCAACRLCLCVHGERQRCQQGHPQPGQVRRSPQAPSSISTCLQCCLRSSSVGVLLSQEMTPTGTGRSCSCQCLGRTVEEVASSVCHACTCPVIMAAGELFLCVVWICTGMSLGTSGGLCGWSGPR
jgi:hypothetical protein